MKKSCIILIELAMSVMAIIWLGCNGSNITHVGLGISNFRFHNVINPQNSCCTDYYYFLWDQVDSGGHYYKIYVTDNSEQVTLDSNISTTYISAPFLFFIPIEYSQKIPQGTYKFFLVAFDDQGNEIDRAGPVQLTVNSYPRDSCYVSCCTGYPEKRYYALAQRQINGVNGISAEIEARYGKVCREGWGHEPGFCVVYCGIADSTSNFSGQAGFGYERNLVQFGTQNTTPYWYYEIISVDANDSITVMDNYETWCCPPVPPEAYYYSYKCEFDSGSGNWEFTINNIKLDPVYSPLSQNCTFEKATWSGEIYNFEDDMAGTLIDSCNINDCEYRIMGGSFQFITFNQNDLLSDDSTEWGVDTNGDRSILIWDNSLQP